MGDDVVSDLGMKRNGGIIIILIAHTAGASHERLLGYRGTKTDAHHWSSVTSGWFDKS